MIKQLILKNFTVFPEAEFQFGSNLNVLTGENGVGKSHILKLAYCILAVAARGERETGSKAPTKTYLVTALANKLRNVFKPDELGRLVRRQAGKGGCEVSAMFDYSRLDLSFGFHAASESTVEVSACPSTWVYQSKSPTFFPTRELLTLGSTFVSLYETTHLPFEETWRDTCVLLGAPLAKGKREEVAREMLTPLEAAMGGTVETDSQGRFYLKTETGKVEMHLVAEGLRKLAMVARLVANGSFVNKGYLFWDEPEANLNPKMIKVLARTILEISRRDIQVFVATHSLFLMRELQILQSQEFKELDTRYFGLHANPTGVAVQQSSDLEEIGDIVSLDEELAQSERYLAEEEVRA